MSAKKQNAVKREAGKTSAKENEIVNDSMTAEIGKIYLTMKKENGNCSIEFSTDCVDPDLNHLCGYCADNHDVMLAPEEMFTCCLGYSIAEIDQDQFDAIRKYIANYTNWKFKRDVDDSDLIEYED